MSATKTYVINETTPRLGKAGDTVEMTEREARYWVSGGVISEAKAPAATAKKKRG